MSKKICTITEEDALIYNRNLSSRAKYNNKMVMEMTNIELESAIKEVKIKPISFVRWKQIFEQEKAYRQFINNSLKTS